MISLLILLFGVALIMILWAVVDDLLFPLWPPDPGEPHPQRPNPTVESR